MSPRVASLWRYPIKAVGREDIGSVDLIAGQTLPGDRQWAVAHEASVAEDGAWSRCGQFLRAASSPALMAIELRRSGDRLILSHPGRPDLTVAPDETPDALLDWLRPLVAEGRPAPARIVRAPEGRGMTDTSDPSISLASLASHGAVEAAAGGPVSIHRWRCNIWLDGLSPWDEFAWVGRRLRLGQAEAEVTRRIDRCMATTANPATGERDMDTLDLLDRFGARDFSVGLTVTKGGTLSVGDTVEVLP